MRVTTLLNRLLGLPGLRVTGVTFEGEEDEVLVIRIARTFKLLTCPDCGRQVRGRFEERPPRRWRHLRVLGHVTYLEGTIRRLHCPDCEQVVTEAVPWARPRSVFTRPFENTVALLVQQLSKTAVSKMMGIAWVTVGSIAERVMAEELDEKRLDGLERIGVDEIHYRTPHRYLSVIVNHDGGDVVWATEGKSSEAFETFVDELGPERAAAIKLVTMDMSAAYQKGVREGLPNAEIVFDRFHLARLAHKALNQVRRDQLEALRDALELDPDLGPLKGLSWLLLKRPENLQSHEKRRLSRLQQLNRPLYRAYLLKESFLNLFKLSRSTKNAERALDAWLAWASRCRLQPFVKLARTVRDHRAGIVRALELPLSNARLEGTNNKIRLLSHRAYGFHSAAALVAMIYLCCSSIHFPTSLLHVF